MPEKLLPPVTLKMFLPHKDRSRETNLHLLRLVGHFTGKGRLRLFRWLRNGGDLPDEESRENNDYILQQTAENYQLPDENSPREFYLNAMRGPRRLVEHIGDVLPEVGRSFELKDELGNCSENPIDLFWYLSRPPGEIDRTLEFELQRHILLGHISALINARTLRAKSRTVLAEIQKHFNKSLYQGPIGSGDNFFLESIHDDETNEVIGFRDDMERIPPTAHLKRRRFTVRTIPDIGYVYTSPRKKDDWTAIIKVLRMAQHNKKGIIDINRIEDSIGMMFVPMDYKQPAEEVSDRIMSVLESGPKEIVRIDRENEVDSYGGQSPKFKFDDRRKIWFKDDPVPFELGVLKTETYLNGELEVGERDRETGIFDGRAYELFRLKRMINVLPILFPKEIFDRDPEVKLDLDKIIAYRMLLKAQELRDRYKLY